MGYRVVRTISEAKSVGRGSPSRDSGSFLPEGAGAPQPAEPWKAILAGGQARFNGMADIGSPAIVTYAFAPEKGAGIQRAVADTALVAGMHAGVTAAETAAGVRFVEVDADADPMISVEYITDGSGWSWAHYPSVSTGSPNSRGSLLMGDTMTDFSPGAWGFEILLHELGHALGLKHPHEGAPRLDTGLDDSAHTVMSYNRMEAPQEAYRPFDVAALRHLYGGPATLDGVVTHYRAATDVVVAKGTAGGDTLIGVNGVTVLKGLGGNDVLIARAADDRLVGGPGHDWLSGSDGRDVLMGGRGNDTLGGGSGNDRLDGWTGRDVLCGGGGKDLLDGGGGHDRLNGGLGADTLIGGRGDDVYRGGPGADVFDAGRGHDVVVDFDPREGDRIDIADLDLSASEAADRLVVTRGDLVLDTGTGTLTLQGAADHGHGDWLFIA
ncbi:hypothetical protein DLJ53_21300 [Acuticoccus sediminis]|uniref:Peptidase metallopeptidase domain-containing protein n=1 Tax=Acuticoccus sediminis TaxID=2184697 RepID=A0A8B2NT02_9HYPH|nr:hypothetical protein DLJ53_21300 [Acuticoccus sediminis]